MKRYRLDLSLPPSTKKFKYKKQWFSDTGQRAVQDVMLKEGKGSGPGVSRLHPRQGQRPGFLGSQGSRTRSRARSGNRNLASAKRRKPRSRGTRRRAPRASAPHVRPTPHSTLRPRHLRERARRRACAARPCAARSR